MARSTKEAGRWLGDESQSEASVPTFHNGSFHFEMVPRKKTRWLNIQPSEPVP